MRSRAQFKRFAQIIFHYLNLYDENASVILLLSFRLFVFTLVLFHSLLRDATKVRFTRTRYDSFKYMNIIHFENWYSTIKILLRGDHLLEIWRTNEHKKYETLRSTQYMLSTIQWQILRKPWVSYVFDINTGRIMWVVKNGFGFFGHKYIWSPWVIVM